MATYYGDKTKYVPDGTHYFRARLDLAGKDNGTTYTVTATVYHQRDTEVKLASNAWQYSLTGASSAKYPASDVSRDDGAVKLATKTYTYSKTAQAQAKSFTATLKRLYNPDSGKKSTATGSVTIPALATYKIAYNANGGAGAPASQTKTQGTAITLSAVKPTRTGYSFAGWATSSTGSVAYSAGARYANDAAATLWAVWKGVPYTVAFDAGGGTGSMASQAMAYGTATALRANAFVRQGFSFASWTCVDGSGASRTLADGQKVSDLATTAGETITLTAQWTAETMITGVSAVNCDESGAEDDDGPCALITAAYTYGNETVGAPASATCAIATAPDGASVGEPSYSTGSVSWLVTGVTPDAASAYTVTITGGGASARSATVRLPAVSRVIDAKAGGKGLGLGAAAPEAGLAVGYAASFKSTLDVAGALGVAGETVSASTAQFKLGAAPDANVYAPSFRALDSEGTEFAKFRGFQLANGVAGAQMEAMRAVNGSNVWNGVSLGIAADGSKSVTLGGADAWLDALGAGGEEVSAIASVIAAGSGVTIGSLAYRRWGRVAALNIAWSYGSAISVPASGNVTNVTVGTLVSGKRPWVQAYGKSGGDSAGAAWYNVNTNGLVTLGACEGTGAARSIAKGTTFNLYAVYMLA